MPASPRAVDELGALLARADFVPPYELFAEVLGARRRPARRCWRGSGREAADPIDEFLAARARL